MAGTNKVEVSMETATMLPVSNLSYEQICRDAAVCAGTWQAQSFTVGGVTKRRKAAHLGCYRHWVDITFYRDTVGKEIVFMHQ